MTYNNNRTYSFSNHQQHNQFNAPYNPNYGGFNNNQPRFKKSGAKYGIIKKGQFEDLPIVNAWMKTRQGLVTIKVAPYHKTKSHDSGNGNAFFSMIAEIRYPSGHTKLVPVLMNRSNKKIPIPNENLLITPNGGGVTKSGKRVTGSVVKLR